MSTNPEIAALQRQLDALKRLHHQPVGDRAEFTAAQLKANAAYLALGDSAPAPLSGECIVPYRQRLLEGVKHLSRRWAAIPVSGLGDPAALSAVEADVFHDAVTSLSDPSRFRPGEMRAISTPDAAGRPITRYVGHPSACWDQFNPAFRYVRGGVNGFTAPKIGSR